MQVLMLLDFVVTWNNAWVDMDDERCAPFAFTSIPCKSVCCMFLMMGAAGWLILPVLDPCDALASQFHTLTLLCWPCDCLASLHSMPL